MKELRMEALAALANRQGQVIINSEYFVYSNGRPGSSVAAGASATYTVQIQADSDFLVEKTAYHADSAGAAQTDSSRPIPNVLVTVVATGSGKQLSNVGVPVPSVFGYGALPFILPQPYFVPASSVIQLTVQSFEAATAWFLTFSFIGRKIYWGAPAIRAAQQR